MLLVMLLRIFFTFRSLHRKSYNCSTIFCQYYIIY